MSILSNRFPCYDYFLRTFYAAGYYQPSIDDVGCAIHDCTKRGKRLGGKRTPALQYMLESLVKRQPDAAAKLKAQHAYDSQFMGWLNRISANVPAVDSSDMITRGCECSQK